MVIFEKNYSFDAMVIVEVICEIGLSSLRSKISDFKSKIRWFLIIFVRLEEVSSFCNWSLLR